MQNRLCYYINPQSTILVLHPRKLSLHILDNTGCDIILQVDILASTLDRVTHCLNRFIVRLAMEVVDEFVSKFVGIDVLDDVLGLAALGEAIGHGIDSFRSMVVEHVGEGLITEAHFGDLGREFVLIGVLRVVRLVCGLIIVLRLVRGLVLLVAIL
ncbi:hypothetical protein BDD12DRAFT_830465 [Trichophaea hybrida]|nr:hypothetical protein BDD12DRAFT_830465 [Trichophaea hybrida]